MNFAALACAVKNNLFLSLEKRKNLVPFGDEA